MIIIDIKGAALGASISLDGLRARLLVGRRHELNRFKGEIFMESNRRRRFLLIAMFAVFGLVAAACGDADDGVSASDEPAAEEPAAEEPAIEAPTLKVGSICATTGPIAPGIANDCDMIDAMFQWFNDNPDVTGGYTFEHIKGDDGFVDAARGSALVKEFIEADGVDFIFAIMAPFTCAAVTDFVDDAGVPTFCAGANDADYGHEMVFVNSPSVLKVSSRAAAQYLVTELGHTRIASIEQDLPNYNQALDEFERVVTELGGEVVSRIKIAGDETDYTGAVVNTRDANPDSVYSLLLPNGVSAWYQSAIIVDYKPVLLQGPTGDSVRIPTEVPDGFALPFEAIVTLAPPDLGTEFYDIKFTYYPDSPVGVGISSRAIYQTSLGIAQALNNLGPDYSQAGFIEALNAGTYDSRGITPPWQFTHDLQVLPFEDYWMERYNVDTGVFESILSIHDDFAASEDFG